MLKDLMVNSRQKTNNPHNNFKISEIINLIVGTVIDFNKFI